MSNKFYAILRAIIEHPSYAKGIAYGKPRKGHQEGTVANHLKELDENLDRMKYHISEDDFWKLEILIHVHDTFKLWAVRDCPIDDMNSHASLARDFLSKFTDDHDLLEMVQWHDENFALWKQFRKNGVYNQERFISRILAIQDLDLFLIFTILDGYTASKMALSAEAEKPEKLRWFVEEVHARRPVPRAQMALEIFGL